MLKVASWRNFLPAKHYRTSQTALGAKWAFVCFVWNELNSHQPPALAGSTCAIVRDLKVHPICSIWPIYTNTVWLFSFLVLDMCFWAVSPMKPISAYTCINECAPPPAIKTAQHVAHSFIVTLWVVQIDPQLNFFFKFVFWAFLRHLKFKISLDFW